MRRALRRIYSTAVLWGVVGGELGCLELDPGFVVPIKGQNSDEILDVQLNEEDTTLDSTNGSDGDGSTEDASETGGRGSLQDLADLSDLDSTGEDSDGGDASGSNSSTSIETGDTGGTGSIGDETSMEEATSTGMESTGTESATSTESTGTESTSTESTGTESTGDPSSFEPSDLNGLVLWMKSDQGVLNNLGNPPSDGETVSTWIGQGPNMVSTGAQSGWSTPIYKENALAGYPVLKFDGASHLIISESLQIGFVYIVANSDEPGSTFPEFAGLLGNKNSGAMNHKAVLFGRRFEDAVHTSAEGQVRTNTVLGRNFLPFAEYKLISFEPTSTWVAEPPIGLGRADFGIATVSSWLGGIAEVIIYDRLLSSEEAMEVETYLADRYQLVF